jgi:hypothetical protein
MAVAGAADGPMATPAEIGTKVLAILAAQAERRRQESAALHREIALLMAVHTGSERLPAKRVRKLLCRCPSPSLRTIQDHMRQINAASPVPRF